MEEIFTLKSSSAQKYLLYLPKNNQFCKQKNYYIYLKKNNFLSKEKISYTYPIKQTIFLINFKRKKNEVINKQTAGII